ncbi:MAG: DUF6159 family protein [Acidimicrobiia bacterium]
MNRIAASWEIAKRSWAVLRSDKSLAWFPIFSFLGSVAVFAVIGGLIALMGIDDSSTGSSLKPLGWVLIVIAYLALAFVQTYFLAALVAGADQRLQGRNSTVSSALQVANSRLHRLLPWAAVSATVSIVISMIERQGIIGQVIARLVGLAWNLVTFLTIPILVIEDIGVGAAFTRSKDLFKQTWGENVVGQFGLGAVGFLVTLPAFAFIGIGAALGTAGLIVLGGVAVVWLIVTATIMSALSGIYRTALYRYATSGQVPADFAGSDFRAAFRQKRGRES